MKKVIFFIAFIIVVGLSLNAEDLQSSLESLSGTAAVSYVNPMVSAFGSNLNGGWYHSSPKAKLFKWDLEFGVVMMGSMFTDDDKTFDANADFQFNHDQAHDIASSAVESGEPYHDQMVDALTTAIMNQTFNIRIKGPTVIGEEYNEAAPLNPDGTNPTSVGIIFSGVNNYEYTYTYLGYSHTETVNLPNKVFILPFGGVLKDLTALPLAAPQLTIGTIAGTKFALRYLPEMELMPEIGNLNYIGFGIQHNPAYWIPFQLPVDIDLSYFTQSMDIGDIIETDASTYGLHVSKTLGARLFNFTPYAGFSMESAKMKFHYTYDTGSDLVEPLKVAFEVEGKNTSRLTVGASFRLAILNLNFDYNIAKYPSATMGLMLNWSF